MSLILLKNRTLKPAQIFNAGQQGFWFDAVTPGVLFQDLAGTTPVSAAEQPVGLGIDRSGNINHASQATAAARPTSRSRVNLLTYSEDFTNAAWVKNNVSLSVAGSVTPPPGFSVSYKLTESAVTNSHALYSPSGFTLPRVSYTFRVIVKAAERAWVALGLYRQSGGNTMVWFNLTTGQKGSSSQSATSPFSYSISPVGDGWYACRLDLTSNVPAQCAIYPTTGDAVSSYLGDGSSGVYVAAVDLRAYYNADKYASYQKVAAADVYTTEGFPLYVAFDKVDDRLLLTVPTGGFVGTLVLATTEGTAAYGVNIPAGTWALGANTTTGTIYFPGTAIVGAICRHGAMTNSEIARCVAYLISKGGGPDNYSGITSFANYWRNAAWLTGFVANAFNGSTATDFTNAFTGCALDQTSVDNILVSINSNGTSGGTLNLTGGTNSAPSATGAAAVTALQSRGWTVTTN